MHIKLTLFFLAFSFLNILGQADALNTRKDSIIAINTFVYDLNYGISMFHKYCPNQKTYSKTGQLIREINYLQMNDSSKHEIKEIIYYYYKNDRILSKEHYSIDANLLFLYVYEFNKTTEDTLRIRKGNIQNNRFIVSKTKKFKYKKGELVKMTSYNKNNKKTSITTFINSANKEQQNEVFTKHSDFYNKLISKESINIIKNETIVRRLNIVNYKDGIKDTAICNINYNDDKVIIEKNIYNKNDSLIKRIAFSYYPDGEMKSKSGFDSQDKRISFTSFEVKNFIINFGGIESAYLKLE